MADRVAILGVPVDTLSGIPEAVGAVEAMLRQPGSCRALFAVNPEKVMAAQKDPALLAALGRASLLVPDGIGVVLAARRLGHTRTRRVPGVELMEALCESAAERGWPVFLLGARPEINAKAAEELQRRHPALRIAGRRDGFFGPADEEAVVAAINASGARLVFVALGSPKQELWVDRSCDALTAGLCQGVGGSFDVLAGTVKRAPALFRRLNLEWFYRLASNPRRLLRQTALPRFAWALVKSGLGRRR